jgi:glutathione S-transferase
MRMKLHYSTTSPYVRKVMAVAIETGLRERIELATRQLTPVAPNADVNADNPLGKVPCLVTDDGMALYDSRVIVAYLDSLHDGRTMIPPAGPERWTALRREALADGILDAAIVNRYEITLRPEEKRWADWSDGQMAKVRRALDALEAEAPDFGERVDLGTLAVACALGYLDLRYADLDWAAGRPALAAWHGRFAERPSMAETRPPA